MMSRHEKIIRIGDMIADSSDIQCLMIMKRKPLPESTWFSATDVLPFDLYSFTE